MSNGPFEGKVLRFLTSLVLPVDPKRKGECLRCGACCKFFVKCPFLTYDKGDGGRPRCMAYGIRPLQCRKYPRTKKEQMHQPCGYYFED